MSFKNIKEQINLKDKNKTYFIADIAANHDGSLNRAKKLIRLCAKAGANAAKFQHFKAHTIVSNNGFKQIGKMSHQAKWKNSVFEVYKDASINPKWTSALKRECDKNNIDFMTAPYDLDYVDLVDKFIPAYKIGSGDITWKEILIKIAKKNKPILLATGASSINDVKKAVSLLKKYNKKIILMQCNTNYTNSKNNFEYINLNVLKQYKKIFKNVTLGLSDHTQGYETVLGAIALGAKVIEKHFTDSNSRNGPDHKFSMNPITWKQMVNAARNLEKAMGDGIKKIEKNELESCVVQRRGIWLNTDLKKGGVIKKSMLNILRPCPNGTLSAFELDYVVGKKINKTIKNNTALKKEWIK
jgi:N-acetylneuraminate synthase